MSINVEIDADGVAQVILNEPPVNAVSSAAMREIARSFEALGADDRVRVVVLSGSGRGFCAGVDVRDLVSAPDAIVQVNRQAFDSYEAIHHCPVPVIAAVHGYALGGGLAMVGACDMVLAAYGTKFGLPEIDRAMLGGASHALRMLPMFCIRQAYFTGEPVLAEEAYRLGGLNGVYPLEELMPAALRLAKKIATKNATVVRFAKEALNNIEPVDLEKNYRYEQGFTFEVSYLPDAAEARQAFLEKRAPRFTR